MNDPLGKSHGISVNVSFFGNVFVSFCIFMLTNQKLGFAHTANQLSFFQPHIKKEIGGARDKDNFFLLRLLDCIGNCFSKKTKILV